MSLTIQDTAEPPCRHEPPRDGALDIALVNNMPDSALKATERQFGELLTAASDGRDVHLHVFSLPEVPRSTAGNLHVRQAYGQMDAFWAARFDGLIVTGTEPRTPELAEEPYWPALQRLIEWADERTSSTIWSCLAAHAAAQHLDGIKRRPVGPKLSGLFECRKAADDAVVAGLPPRWHIPHSRYNELPRRALVRRGYRILSVSSEAGIDMIARQGRSLFLLLQGHPEYDPGALLREYRRDVGRFLAGERDTYPDMPRAYFDAGTAAALDDFRAGALARPTPDLLPLFPLAAAEGSHPISWRDVAVRLYSNWLSYLADQAAERRMLAPGLSQQHAAV
jgi:homoserine O-succinyltransferase